MIILSQSTFQTLLVPEGGNGRVQQRLPASPDSYIHSFIYLFTYLFIYLPIYLFTYLFIYLFIHLFVY